jgi:hypothetical protein
MNEPGKDFTELFFVTGKCTVSTRPAIWRPESELQSYQCQRQVSDHAADRTPGAFTSTDYVLAPTLCTSACVRLMNMNMRRPTYHLSLLRTFSPPLALPTIVLALPHDRRDIAGT